jgi:hypothetical protein
MTSRTGARPEAPARQPRRRPPDVRREQILDAAERGLATTTMVDVAGAAAVATEAALRWKPGETETDMRPQLDRLSSMASLPSVTISVLPIGAGSPPILHPFVIWHLEDEITVSVETYSAELWVTERREVDRYREVWQRLSETAQPWRPGSWPTPGP